MNDERLQSEGQRQAAEWVRGLPDETPNLAWRAALNETVRAESARRAKRRVRWTWARPLIGLAAATGLAFVAFTPRTLPSRLNAGAAARSSHLAAGLVALHDETVRTDDIVGSGLRPSEETPSPSSEGDPLDDLDAGVM